MTRLHLDFGCGSHKLAGTLDSAPGLTGLLLVSGGNEIRSGAFCGQARLAAQIARKGFPVFRFDRRGIGDSEGENRGFRKSRKDIAAALEAFRALAPQMQRVIGFGNCDAASALMLMQGAGFDGLVLSNPWTIDDNAEASGDASDLPAASIRQRYMQKLGRPSEWKRLLSGQVSLKKLSRGLTRAVSRKRETSALADEMRAGLQAFPGTARILLASADRTAQVFEDRWDAGDFPIFRCEGADHAYSGVAEREWLQQQILAALRS